MNRSVDLLRYLPTFMQEYVELFEIMKSENVDFKYAEEERERALNNQFLKTCDEEGISKFEEIYGVEADENSTLSSRQTKVMLKLNDKLPYTKVWLNNFLVSAFGKDNYALKIDNENYLICIELALTSSLTAEALRNKLISLIPANLRLEYDFDIGITVYTAISVQEQEYMSIEAN